MVPDSLNPRAFRSGWTAFRVGPRRAAHRLVGLRGLPHAACSSATPSVGQDRGRDRRRAHPLRGHAPGLLRPRGPPRRTWTLNHVERSLCFPTFPRFCGQTFLEGTRPRPRACLRAGLQRLHGRGVGRRERRPPDPAVPHPAVGRRPGRRRGPPQRRARASGRSPSASCPPPWACRASTTATATGIRSSAPATRPARSSACTSARPRHRCRSPRTTRPAHVQISLTTINAQLSMSDWLLSGVLARFPEPQAGVLRGPDRLDAVPARAAGHAVAQGQLRRRVGPGHHRATRARYVPGRIFGLLLRGRLRHLASGTRSGSTRSPSRPTTPTRTPPGPTAGPTRRRSSGACRPRTSRRSCGATPSGCSSCPTSSPAPPPPRGRQA